MFTNYVAVHEYSVSLFMGVLTKLSGLTEENTYPITAYRVVLGPRLDRNILKRLPTHQKTSPAWNINLSESWLRLGKECRDSINNPPRDPLVTACHRDPTPDNIFILRHH